MKPSKDTGGYAHVWDQYVARQRERADGVPGEEWGSPESWRNLFSGLFVPAKPSEWERAVEIGPGAGKYSAMTLAASSCTLRAYDVSQSFLAVLHEREVGFIDEGRLVPRLLRGTSADEMLCDLDAAGWRRRVDCFFSIDSMVHVDLQYLVAYLLTAGLVLRPGGWLILTLATAATRDGFQRLMRQIRPFYPQQDRPCGKFEALSRPLVLDLLSRLGFAVEWYGNGEDDPGRDIGVRAKLVAPQRSAALEHKLRPVRQAG